MSFSPFERGRLALSNAAIKIIAKRLSSDDPLTAIAAGLRAHHGDMPFDVLGEPVRDLTIMGMDGSGCVETGYGYVREATAAGFRSVIISSAPDIFWKGRSRETFWGQDPEQGCVTIRHAARTSARALHIGGDDFTKLTALDAIRSFLERSLEDVSTREMHLSIPAFQKLSDRDSDHLLSLMASGLRSVSENLDDAVLFFDKFPSKGGDLDLVSSRAAGVIRTVWARARRTEVDEGTLYLFGKHALPETDDFKAGDFLVGTPADVLGHRPLPKISGPYTTEAAHDLHRTVVRALNVIHAEPGVARLPYTARLDLVARACGHSGWHAAEACGRGSVRRFLSAFGKMAG